MNHLLVEESPVIILFCDGCPADTEQHWNLKANSMNTLNLERVRKKLSMASYTSRAAAEVSAAALLES